jgi:creatinine amidohydrolase/Fe(II)-dependent formamide hydrolase-like protein
VRRDLIKTAVGEPTPGAGRGPNASRNGIVGDARRSSAELGKIFFEMKVDYAVGQIRRFVAQR